MGWVEGTLELIQVQPAAAPSVGFTSQPSPWVPPPSASVIPSSSSPWSCFSSSRPLSKAPLRVPRSPFRLWSCSKLFQSLPRSRRGSVELLQPLGAPCGSSGPAPRAPGLQEAPEPPRWSSEVGGGAGALPWEAVAQRALPGVPEEKLLFPHPPCPASRGIPLEFPPMDPL